MILSFPHFGIYVADMDKSIRFYVEGLGFTPLDGGTTDAAGPLLGIPGAVARTQFLEHRSGGPRIELWTVKNHPPAGSVTGGPANQCGRVHLCVGVENLDQTASRIVEYGGQRLDDSRCDQGYGEIMFCTDPDGLRIELVQMRAIWPGYPDQPAN
ncbi:hypothetical protein MB02_02350 [Croceicoccus estronivorus]|uniref:VOC family protein n=1 Tax=Croceicoccus estronivorus TaxID=1172626 RepID=UPI00082C1B62|nr:VOC family protein [Croceicoccus estronivorus]OCC25497.1 hypothetical protein MB02_02350 [Croceicoccus estronivorus]